MFFKLIYGESKYYSVCGKMIGNTKDCWYAMLWNENVLMFLSFVTMELYRGWIM